jgi:hypothetical protein
MEASRLLHGFLFFLRHALDVIIQERLQSADPTRWLCLRMVGNVNGKENLQSVRPSSRCFANIPILKNKEKSCHKLDFLCV